MPITARSARHQPAKRALRPNTVRKSHIPSKRCVLARSDPDEEEFEKRLAQLNKSRVPTGTSRKDSKEDSKSTKNRKAKVEVSYDDEKLWREFSPAKADLAFNVAMAATLVWIPLTASAVGRCAFIKYAISDKRIRVITDAPWKKDESQLGFHEVAQVVGVNRGFGLWGDMVVTLSSGDKLELRSIPQWQEVRDYILERRDAIRGKDLTQAELLDGPDSTPDSGSGPSSGSGPGTGFA